MIQTKLCKPRTQIKQEYKEKTLTSCLRPHPIQICFDPINKKPVPLRNVHYYLNVQSGIVIVEMKQEYSTQEYDKPTDVEYLFIINENATVTKMMVKIGDEKKFGIIKEKVEAQIEYEEGIQQGKTMAYSDQNEEIPEMKRVKIGALSPNKTLKITFEYVQPLEVFLNKYWKIEISPLIDPFYINKNDVQDYFSNQQKLNQKIKELVQLTQINFNYQQSISVEINNGSIITSYKSPTHKILSTAAKDQAKLDEQENYNKKLTIMLEDTPENYKPNKQFILLFSSDDINLPKAILTHTNQDALQAQKYCATLTLIPKFNETSLDDAYQQYLDGMNIAYDAKINRGNYLFFIDRSGSMQGNRIGKAREALILFLKSLPENSFFNIISFGGKFKSLWSESKQYSQQTLDEAINHVKKISADMGGTEIYKPLQEVVYNKQLIQKQKELQMTQNIFLLTDGEVTAKPIIDLISSNQSAEIRIYSLGIGDGCSQYLIKKVAEVGNGKYHIMSDYEDINAKVIDLLEDSLTSYLKAFKLETNAPKLSTIIPAPDSIVSLKKNQELMIQVIFSPEQQNQNVEFNLSCFDPQEQKPITYNITLNLEQSIQNEYFHKIAAHRFIKIVENSMNESKEFINQIDYQQNYVSIEDLINISVQNQILSSKTAFICEVCNLEDQFKQQTREKVVINKFIHNQQFESNYMACRLPSASNQTTFIKKCAPVKIMDQSQLCNLVQEIKRDQQQIMREVGKQLSHYYDDEDEKEDMFQMKCKYLKSKHCESKCQDKKKKDEQIFLKIFASQNITYQDLILFAQADGSFMIPSQIQQFLRIQEFSDCVFQNQLVSFTLISLFYLELFCADQKQSWQLVFSKAISFLQKNGIKYKEEKEKLLDKYKIMMLQ